MVEHPVLEDQNERTRISEYNGRIVILCLEYFEREDLPEVDRRRIGKLKEAVYSVIRPAWVRQVMLFPPSHPELTNFRRAVGYWIRPDADEKGTHPFGLKELLIDRV
jgi:hypothetical protein